MHSLVHRSKEEGIKRRIDKDVENIDVIIEVAGRREVQRGDMTSGRQFQDQRRFGRSSKSLSDSSSTTWNACRTLHCNHDHDYWELSSYLCINSSLASWYDERSMKDNDHGVKYIVL
jgi:hypothetical protein